MPKMGFEHAAEQEQARLGELLWDLHAAAMKTLEFTSGRDFHDFTTTEVLRSAVAAMLGIVTDCLRQLQIRYPDQFNRISNAIRLLEAGSANEEKLWQLVEEQIPELVAESRALLEDWHQA